MFKISVQKVSPTVKDPSKWTDKFLSFIKYALTNNSDNRPEAEQLLLHPFLYEADQKADSLRNMIDEAIRQRRDKVRHFSSDSHISRSSHKSKQVVACQHHKVAPEVTALVRLYPRRPRKLASTTPGTSHLPVWTGILQTEPQCSTHRQIKRMMSTNLALYWFLLLKRFQHPPSSLNSWTSMMRLQKTRVEPQSFDTMWRM